MTNPSTQNLDGSGTVKRPRLGDRMFSKKTLAVSVIAIALFGVTTFRFLDIDWRDFSTTLASGFEGFGGD